MGIDEECGIPGHFRERCQIAAYDGAIAAHGLQERNAEPLEQRRINQRNSPLVQADKVVQWTIAEKLHCVLQARFFNETQ